MGFTGPSYQFEMFITAPGLYAFEWLFSLWMIPVTAVLTGLFSGYIAMFLYINFFIRYKSRKGTIGITQTEELSPAMKWIKIFIRSFILALFTMNLSYMLSSQEIVVDVIRLDQPASSIILPDPLTMYGLLYLVIIPCSFLLVPIWISNDIGIISSKKIRKKNINDVKLVSTPIYKLVKGYVGIGFIFNLIVMIANIALNTYGDAFSLTLLIISPLIIVFFVTPIVVLIEIGQMSFKKRILGMLEKLGLNKKIEVIINLN
jgi:hypothetical protein